MKRKIALLLVVVMVLTFSLVGCSGDEDVVKSPADDTPNVLDKTPEKDPEVEITDIAIGTAAAGGAWYPIGAVFSDIISTSDLGIQASVQTTGGGIENCKLVNNGDTEIAITIGYLAYNAQNGLEPYPDKMENISGLFGGLSVGVMQLVVPEDSDIQSYADLKGKKVAVGPAGGGAITCLSAALEQYGVDYSEIEPSYVSYDEGISMMTDKNVDAAVVYGGVPTPAVKTLEAGNKPFRILTLTKDEQEAIMEKITYFEAVTIPANLYGLSEDVLTLGTANIVIVNKDMPEDLVYEICSLFFANENLARIQGSQPSAKGLTLEKAGKMPIPLHPGAERFFIEKGII